VHIAGPDNDEGFWAAYRKTLEASPNISYEGFLDVSGKRFSELCAECAFVTSRLPHPDGDDLRAAIHFSVLLGLLPC
ncbi:MAG: hypothetical protein ACE1ZA_08845, partial [Pseudomonadales bacterium]